MAVSGPTRVPTSDVLPRVCNERAHVRLPPTPAARYRDVLVFTDTLPVNERRKAAEKAIKTTCRHELPDEIRFESYHHPSASNLWLQLDDYRSWAVFKKWEQGDTRMYDQLRHRLSEPELDALRLGTVKLY